MAIKQNNTIYFLAYVVLPHRVTPLREFIFFFGCDNGTLIYRHVVEKVLQNVIEN